MRIKLLLTLAGFSCTLLASSALAGPDWIEVGDAGASAGSAQVPRRPPGATSFNTISGSLGGDQRGGDFDDLYFIRIVAPTGFVVSPDVAGFDAALYLFVYEPEGDNAYGLLGNDNEHVETTRPRLSQFSTDGSEAFIGEPGDYILAITSATRFPISSLGEICFFETSTEISGPDGVGGSGPLSGWSGEGSSGAYHIEMTSVDFPSVPAPTTLALSGIAAVFLGRRR